MPSQSDTLTMMCLLTTGNRTLPFVSMFLLLTTDKKPRVPIVIGMHTHPEGNILNFGCQT